MKLTKPTIDSSKLSLLALMLGIALPGMSHAHGNEHHAASSTEPAKMEQTDWGIAGEAKHVKRVIPVKMLDKMRFTPDHLQVRAGETVKFVIHNSGQLQHEFVIGTKHALEDHAALMVKFPDMQHDEPYMAHVAPGKTETITWQFNRAGEFGFACLMAGHYQSGMVGSIKVLTAGKSPHKTSADSKGSGSSSGAAATEHTHHQH